MPLNPQIEALLAQFAQIPMPDYATATPEDIRAINDQPLAQGPRPEVARAEDLTIDLPGRSLKARLYVPEGAGERPALTLFFHGGGWVIGTLDTHDATCRALARASGSAVLSVDYRLAPEHPHPAAVDDCFEALRWAAAHAEQLGADGSRLAVAGDSAGGNLAAATAIRARDEGGPRLRFQLLLYPVTDHDFTRASYVEHGGEGNFLTKTMMLWFWRHYLGGEPAGHIPLVTVQRTPDLSGLPPAMVLVAEYDPLRDEGLAYAERLRAAGVSVEAAVAPGMIHGFASLFDAVPDALPWIERAGATLRTFSSRVEAPGNSENAVR